MPEKALPLLGAHVSISKGFTTAIEQTLLIHGNCGQIFTKSSRQWQGKPIDPKQAALFIKAQKENNISPFVAHASYLINLGSTNPETKEKALEALTQELIRCNTLNIPYLILHPGTAPKDAIQQTLTNIGSLIAQAFVKAGPIKTSLLLETMAGQGNSVGHTFEQLAHIMQATTLPEKIGICFDTCHVFAAGYDFRTQETYNALWQEFTKHLKIQDIKIFHMNDSKQPLGSRKDRHEHIGKGHIGLDGFSFIMNDTRFLHVPKILETPKEDSLEPDINNLNVLKSLIKKRSN